MSRATPDDQLKFLLNCVKHSNNGKIDFVEVAKECSIVSKGAAAKRYERLMKANGIHPNGGPSEKPTTETAPREKAKATTVKESATKKRKLEGNTSAMKPEDSFNDLLAKSTISPNESKRIKHEPAFSSIKSPLASSPSPGKAPNPVPMPVQCSSPPQPQHLFNAPLMSYPQHRQYGPHISHMARYQGQFMSLPPPPPPPPAHLALAQHQRPTQRPDPAPQELPVAEDTLIFEDFCTPELFEQRSFLEPQPLEQCGPVPPPPQEVALKDLSIEDKPVENQPAEIRSGKRPSESILIID